MGEHNSGYLFRSKGEIPSGPDDIELFVAERDFLLSDIENIGVGITLSV